MFYPYFALGCSLEINSQRTAAYIQSAKEAGDFPGRIDLKCGCDPLLWAVDENDTWVPAVYTDPGTDQVSWYDASIPESEKFLGFLIEEVTQTQAVASRSIVTRLSASGGGSLGPLRNKERRLDFTVLMFACDEASMEYGFRFLTDALTAPGCDDNCTTCDAEFRESCPPVDGSDDSLNVGRWFLKNVGTVEGPVWGDAPLEGSQCNIRRVRFSIASELPWKFKCPLVECQDIALADYPADGVDCVNWSDILCGDQEVSCSVSESLIIGETGLIIEVTAGDVDLQHLKIAIRPDQFGYECNALSRPSGYTRVDPCDLIYFPAIPANSTLIYDTSIESIIIRLPGGGEISGIPYVATDEGRPPTYPTLRCGEFCISVSASECSVIGDPTVTIKSVHREI